MPMAPSMLFLETQPGVVTARPDLVDEAAIKAWTAVYNGNSGNRAAITGDFINHYAPYLYIQPKPAEVPPFTAAMIMADCRAAPSTSAGWDQWAAEDWRSLEGHAAQRLADLLNGIEAGLSWPEPITWGKAHLLSKDQQASLDPLMYRLLLVLRCLYRRWATMRLHRLAPWITRLQLEKMYVGVPRTGAE